MIYRLLLQSRPCIAWHLPRKVALELLLRILCFYRSQTLLSQILRACAGLGLMVARYHRRHYVLTGRRCHCSLLD